MSETATKKTKAEQFSADEDKVYEFELSTSYENNRPKDRKTDKPIGSPYPPSFGYPNHGIARDPKSGKARNWRYIEGQPSIWTDEQPQLENYDKGDIFALLGQDENQLEFRNGKMLVTGVQSLRIQALMIQDYFEGNDKPYKKINPQFRFRLNNPDIAINKSLAEGDIEFEAMKAARECTVEQMLAVALVFGINIDEKDSDSGLNKIKLEFLNKAKYDPKNPEGIRFFMKVLSNPATKVKFIFAQALQQGLISSSQQPGKLTLSKSNTAVLDLDGKLDVADELTQMVLEKNDKAIGLMNKLDEILSK